MTNLRRWLMLLPLLYGNALPAYSQSLDDNLGDATVIESAAGQTQHYGLEMPQSDDGQEIYASRHRRQGNEGGIGGSFSNTTDITSESQPLSKYTSPAFSRLRSTWRPLPLSSKFTGARVFSPALSSPAFTAPSVGSSMLIDYGQIESVTNTPYIPSWQGPNTSGVVIQDFPLLQDQP